METFRQLFTPILLIYTSAAAIIYAHNDFEAKQDKDTVRDFVQGSCYFILLFGVALIRDIVFK